MSKLDTKTLEAKWQEEWEKKGVNKTPQAPGKKKRYVLDMFPYPSSATMHVGHLEGYVGTDIYCRYLRMQGFSVLHPMGWDAFGLPAENYAIKTGISPDKSTHKNIETFKRQLAASGLSYDWGREIDTSSPDFYKWTQWLFILMFKQGLAYKKRAPVNWCPKDETVLANEQVINGKCERCGAEVVEKELEQWFLKITRYADRLISGLDKIDWPQEVKIQQKNWIGRSEGRIVEFEVEGSGQKIEVFTTRPETLNSATFLALASEQKEPSKEKWGKFSGKYALNPLNGEKLPIWETNYVEAGYGTGAIMGVPAYDERDMEFAKKYQIDMVKRDFTDKILGKKAINYHLRDWLISRQRFWGCPIPMIYCQHCASKDITFKGDTFKGMEGWFPVEESELPVLLPTDVDFLPHGESPIARSKTFQEGVKCPKCGKKAVREVDTMDTYVDSSWYFIRFVDPKNDKEFASFENIKKWLPVDIYVGGGHVVQHLLFARFFWKVLYDAGLIDKSLGDEPFLKLRAPGWILGPDSRKMSKRWGNIITPDDIIPKFGADTLRVYEMFMGPFEVMKPWSITGVEGTARFLQRIWRLYQEYSNEVLVEKKDSEDVLIKMHQTIKKVTEDIQEFKYNTAIAAIMEFVNTLYEVRGGKFEAKSSIIKHQTSNIRCAEWDEALRNLALMLAPFAPHMTEEIWHSQKLYEVGGKKLEFKHPTSNVQHLTSIHLASWPRFNSKLITEENTVIVVQINGRLRGQVIVKTDESSDKEKIIGLAQKDAKVAKWLEEKKIKTAVFVPGKLVNFVVE